MITLDPKLRYALALALMSGMGPQHVRTLGACFEDISQPFREPQLLDQHFPRMQRRVRVLFESSQLLCEADRLLECCQQLALTPLFLLDPNYPQALAECPDAPLILYTRGASEVLQQAPLISIVGTRQASSYGLQMTGRIVTELSELLPESPIVSGLAYGIDIEAHRRALQLGTPCVAVLAHGLDRLYPSVHRPEAERILSSGGVLVSEYPPGTPTQRKQFVARNRIIAGLSVATILPEAGLSSGSLSTARLALSYGREVFAFPGRITDEQSAGCLELLKRGEAQLLSTASDLLDALSWLGTSTPSTRTQPEQAKPVAPAPRPSYNDPLLQLLADQGALSLDELARALGRPMSQLSEELLDLELEGRIVALPGDSYRLA